MKPSLSICLLTLLAFVSSTYYSNGYGMENNGSGMGSYSNAGGVGMGMTGGGYYDSNKFFAYSATLGRDTGPFIGDKIYSISQVLNMEASSGKARALQNIWSAIPDGEGVEKFVNQEKVLLFELKNAYSNLASLEEDLVAARAAKNGWRENYLSQNISRNSENLKLLSNMVSPDIFEKVKAQIASQYLVDGKCRADIFKINEGTMGVDPETEAKEKCQVRWDDYLKNNPKLKETLEKISNTKLSPALEQALIGEGSQIIPNSGRLNSEIAKGKKLSLDLIEGCDMSKIEKVTQAFNEKKGTQVIVVDNLGMEKCDRIRLKWENDPAMDCGLQRYFGSGYAKGSRQALERGVSLRHFISLCKMSREKYRTNNGDIAKDLQKQKSPSNSNQNPIARAAR